MSRSRDTSNTFIEQDQLGRAYSGTNDPVRDKDRLADVWFVEVSTHSGNIFKKLAEKTVTEPKTVSKVGRKSLTKRTRYYKKGASNGRCTGRFNLGW